MWKEPQRKIRAHCCSRETLVPAIWDGLQAVRIGFQPRLLTMAPQMPLAFAMSKRYAIEHFAIAFTLLNAHPIRAQPSTARPEFEVASIKPNKSGRGFDTRFEGGRFTARHTSLQNLIEMAYQVKHYQVSGAPDWWSYETFDIVAKYPPDRVHDGLIKSLPMVRTLLEDRFKLAIHRETKVVSGYALIVAKSGPKLPKSPDTDDETGLSGPRGKMSGHHITVAQIADALSGRLNLPVSDATRLDGFFEVELQWTPDDLSVTPGTDHPTIFTALQEQLGLRLESRKVPVEILVIDHLERSPAEN
jgi:uncharacterized protein (TIGR03435 family)